MSSLNLGAGLGLLYGGSASLTVGSVVGTASYTYRHGRYVRAGFDPRGGPKAGAWILTGFTLASSGASIGLAVAAGSNGDFGLAIGSIAAAGTASILEIINLMSVRLKHWEQALAESATKPRSAEIYPAVFAFRTSDRGDLAPALGAVGVF